MTFDIPSALKALRPNAQWHMIGTEYSNIYWDDKTQTKPTEQEIEEKIAELKYQEEVNEYQEKRKSEYPDWGCLLYTSPSPRDATLSRMPSSA